MELKYLYKYRKISPEKDLDSEPNIKALFNCYAMLSSRTQFEDKQDSKINLIFKPKKKRLKSLFNNCFFHLKEDLKSRFDGMSLKNSAIEEIKSMFEQVIDKYPIYCLASSGDNIRMWEDYTDHHKGFCIEFKKEFIPATAINYRNKIGEINIIDFLQIIFTRTPLNEMEFGRKIHKLLHIKRKQFQYEGEYRFINTGLLEDAPLKIKPYAKEHVSCIIFGHRMRSEHKQFIINNIPFQVSFKQAILVTDNSTSKIILENYDQNKHLYLGS